MIGAATAVEAGSGVASIATATGVDTKCDDAQSTIDESVAG